MKSLETWASAVSKCTLRSQKWKLVHFLFLFLGSGKFQHRFRFVSILLVYGTANDVFQEGGKGFIAQIGWACGVVEYDHNGVEHSLNAYYFYDLFDAIS